MERRAIRVRAAIRGKLVSNEATELESVDVALPVMVGIRTVLVHRPDIC